LIQYGAIKEPTACLASNPAGGCGINWIAARPDASFGYLAIPTLALTGFLLLIEFLVLASAEEADETATLPAHAER
jgi:hypothetical protein